MNYKTGKSNRNILNIPPESSGLFLGKGRIFYRKDWKISRKVKGRAFNELRIRLANNKETFKGLGNIHLYI